jgi:hypothetical protein
LDRWILEINVKVSIDQYGNISAATSGPAGTLCVGS